MLLSTSEKLSIKPKRWTLKTEIFYIVFFENITVSLTFY